MRPTYRNLVDIFSSHPGARYAEQVSGMTTHQFVVGLLHDLEHAPDQRTRDVILSDALRPAGIETSGEEAFNRGTEAMLRDMSNPATTEREAARISAATRSSSQYVSPERIRLLRDAAATSSLQQGLATHMRRSDARQAKHEQPMLPKNPHVEAWRDDSRDRRAALHAAIASTAPEDHVRVGEQASLRDSITAAFDAHADIEAQRDPLEDPRLLSMSDAV